MQPLYLMACLLFGGAIAVHGHIIAGPLIALPAPPLEQAEGERMWREMCKNGHSAGGTDGVNQVFCFQGAEETLQQEITYEPIVLQSDQGPKKDQIIFIEPPSQHYNHKVAVKGNIGAAPKTTIFIKPPVQTHALEVKDETIVSQKEAARPTIHFLKNESPDDSAQAILVPRQSKSITPTTHKDAIATPAALTNEFQRYAVHSAGINVEADTAKNLLGSNSNSNDAANKIFAASISSSSSDSNSQLAPEGNSQTSAAISSSSSSDSNSQLAPKVNSLTSASSRITVQDVPPSTEKSPESSSIPTHPFAFLGRYAAASVGVDATSLANDNGDSDAINGRIFNEVPDIATESTKPSVTDTVTVTTTATTSASVDDSLVVGVSHSDNNAAITPEPFLDVSTQVQVTDGEDFEGQRTKPKRKLRLNRRKLIATVTARPRPQIHCPEGACMSSVFMQMGPKMEMMEEYTVIHTN